MNRHAALDRATANETFDLLVIGGGATGVGIAVDAATRGFSVCLLERHDFGKGTSSRSTKLVHGGVRYLKQLNVSLVKEALSERDILLKNAPHLVRDLPFFIPCFSAMEKACYAIGLRTYDLLAGKHRFGRSHTVSRDEAMARLPTLAPAGLRGGVVYHDGQFDDARLLIDLAKLATSHGASLINYATVVGIDKDASGRASGVRFVDLETQQEHRVRARCVINAAGPFVDEVRRLDQPDAASLVAASQGAHVVLDASFLGGETALMVPKTSDGRVLFAIPWHGKVVVGTTDTPITSLDDEPVAMEHEINFILETAGRYLARKPTRADVLSIFTGIRPLVRPGSGVRKTSSLSRDHTISISDSGLLTITGGKWTTYRHMAEDAVDRAVGLASLAPRACITADLAIPGTPAPEVLSDAFIESVVRDEMARTVEDVLARRSRLLLLDARNAVSHAAHVASVLARELGRDDEWQTEQVRQFSSLAARYLPRT